MTSRYQKLDEAKVGTEIVCTWHSIFEEDRRWDGFVAQLPQGEYEQTSMWARAKALNGWRPIRIVFTIDDRIVGGFQILFKQKLSVFKLGYLSKGPLLLPGFEMMSGFAFDALKKISKSYGIRLLIVQPHSGCDSAESGLVQSGFFLNPIEDLYITATLVLQLSGDLDGLFRRMKPNKKQSIKKGIQRGVCVTEGGAEDLDFFFGCMLETCKRQTVAPNPSSLNYLSNIWGIFSQADCMKLFIASCEGEKVSSAITILLGKKAYIWKFGWTGTHGWFQPNDVLYWEIFKWCKENGYASVDLVGINRRDADAMVSGASRIKNRKGSPSFFKMGFGAGVCFYPESCIYIVNPFARWLLKKLLVFINSKPDLRRKLVGLV